MKRERGSEQAFINLKWAGDLFLKPVLTLCAFSVSYQSRWSLTNKASFDFDAATRLGFHSGESHFQQIFVKDPLASHLNAWGKHQPSSGRLML